MEIKAITSAGVTVIRMSGSVDSLTCQELGEYLEALIQALIQRGEVRLVADLSEVNYISSAGLRVLLSALKSIRQKGGDFHLASVQTNIQQVLTLAGFTAIFEIYPTVEAGMAGF